MHSVLCHNNTYKILRYHKRGFEFFAVVKPGFVYFGLTWREAIEHYDKLRGA